MRTVYNMVFASTSEDTTRRVHTCVHGKRPYLQSLRPQSDDKTTFLQNKKGIQGKRALSLPMTEKGGFIVGGLFYSQELAPRAEQQNRTMDEKNLRLAALLVALLAGAGCSASRLIVVPSVIMIALASACAIMWGLPFFLARKARERDFRTSTGVPGRRVVWTTHARLALGAQTRTCKTFFFDRIMSLIVYFFLLLGFILPLLLLLLFLCRGLDQRCTFMKGSASNSGHSPIHLLTGSLARDLPHTPH